MFVEKFSKQTLQGEQNEIYSDYVINKHSEFVENENDITISEFIHGGYCNHLEKHELFKSQKLHVVINGVKKQFGFSMYKEEWYHKLRHNVAKCMGTKNVRIHLKDGRELSDAKPKEIRSAKRYSFYVTSHEDEGALLDISQRVQHTIPSSVKNNSSVKFCQELSTHLHSAIRENRSMASSKALLTPFVVKALCASSFNSSAASDIAHKLSKKLPLKLARFKNVEDLQQPQIEGVLNDLGLEKLFSWFCSSDYVSDGESDDEDYDYGDSSDEDTPNQYSAGYMRNPPRNVEWDSDDELISKNW